MSGTLFSFTSIPASFGQGGANLAPNDAQGAPSLYTVLAEIETALNLLAPVTGANYIGSNAAGYTATTVAGQLAEVKALADAGMPVLKKTVSVAVADLTDDVDAEPQFINIGTALPANARIVGCCIKLTTPFTGGSVASVAIDIGTAGDPDALVDGADVMSAAADGMASTMPLGVCPNKHFVAAGAQLLAKFIPDSGAHDLEDLTAGACVIDVLYVILA